MSLTREEIEQTKAAVRRHFDEGLSYKAIAAELGLKPPTLQGRIERHAKDVVNEYRNKLRDKDIRDEYIKKKEASKWMDKAYKLGIEQMATKAYLLRQWIKRMVDRDTKRGNNEGARRLQKVLDRMNEMKI